MTRLHSAIEAISLWMARTGGVILLASSAIISFEILSRKLLQLPFNVGTELSAYGLAVAASWSFAYGLLRRSHVRIDVLRNRAGPQVRAALDLLALATLTAVALVLVRYLWDTVEASWTLGARENTPLGTPLIIPHGLWFVGIVWFAIVCGEQLALALHAYWRGDLARLKEIVAPAGVEEEIAEARGGIDPKADPLRGI